MSGTDPRQRLYSELDELNQRRNKLDENELWDEYKKNFSPFLLSPVMQKTGINHIQPSTENDFNSSEYIRLVPKTYREKVKELFTFIEPKIKKSTEIRLSNEGNVIFLSEGGKTGGNILDYLTFTVGRSKNPPIGYEIFRGFLIKLGIPESSLRKDFRVTNTTPTRIRENEEEEEEEFVTPEKLQPDVNKKDIKAYKRKASEELSPVPLSKVEKQYNKPKSVEFIRKWNTYNQMKKNEAKKNS